MDIDVDTDHRRGGSASGGIRLAGGSALPNAPGATMVKLRQSGLAKHG